MAKLYKTKRWENKRKTILKRDEYLCRECRRYGKTTPATTVHHVIPLELRPDLKLDSRNLLSLCEGCHNQMHDRNSAELTEKGLWWAKKISPPPSKIGL
jgi:5-methylcytosine-specific restriction protein A